ncbi:MAG: hypothetical protein ACE366_27885 [Bradymonadia bacterium]
MLTGYEGLKVFTAAKSSERERLGTRLTDWLASTPDIEVVDTIVRQSSDNQFHCLSILVFYRRRTF